jgi:hypothetical protein
MISPPPHKHWSRRSPSSRDEDGHVWYLTGEDHIRNRCQHIKIWDA